MASLNKVMLIGNLTRDPEVKYTPKGTAVAEMAKRRAFLPYLTQMRENHS